MPYDDEAGGEDMGAELMAKAMGPPPAKGDDDGGDETNEAFDDYAQQAFPDMPPKKLRALYKAIMACK